MGLAKCLRLLTKYKIKKKTLKNGFSENDLNLINPYPKPNIIFYFLLYSIFFRDKTGQILTFMCIYQVNSEKKIRGWVGFQKSYVCNYQSGTWQMLTFTYKVGGWGEKWPKTCLHNIWMVLNKMQFLKLELINPGLRK